jgi:transcription elongation regulator 1
MDLTGDIWVETKASEGKSYFYNARTRETTWTKPEGPAVKIITQEQVPLYEFRICCSTCRGNKTTI